MDKTFNPQAIEEKIYKEWEENGKPNLVEQATARKEQILASPPPSHISDQLDSTLREKYPVHLGEKQ